jgi:hypothetical protein
MRFENLVLMFLNLANVFSPSSEDHHEPKHHHPKRDPADYDAVEKMTRLAFYNLYVRVQ